MTEYICGCSEDYGPCESHFDVSVMRIGSAAYSADELCERFIGDAVFLGVQLSEDDAEYFSAVERELANSAWIEDSDIAGGLSDLTNSVESQLSELGFYTEWDDGYRIGIPSGPLFDDNDETPIAKD